MKSFALTGRTSATDKMSDALTKSQATCQGRKDFALRTGISLVEEIRLLSSTYSVALFQFVRGTLVVK